MPQSYSKYTFDDVRDILHIIIRNKSLFPISKIKPIEPSALLKETLRINIQLPLGSEKAKSEFLVAPVLSEIFNLNPHKFTFFSGYNFDIDKKNGLKGHCDFLLSKIADAPIIEAPVFCITEAKNEVLEIGIPQCIAQMYAARLFNQQQHKDITIIYGAVTYGRAWQFLKLEKDTAYLDDQILFLDKLPYILGILQNIIDC